MIALYYIIFYAFLIIAALAGAYLKIIPDTIALSILNLVVGHALGLVTPAPTVPGQPTPTPTPARPITSNAYIPPEVRKDLGVPARASALVPPALVASTTQQHTISAPAEPLQITAVFPVAGTAIQNASVQIPTGGNPAFPEHISFGDTGAVPTVPRQ